MKYMVNFNGGVVDDDSRALIDDAYRSKCAELTNFYIAPDNTIRRRPPLRDARCAPDIKDKGKILDFRTVDDRLLVLSEMRFADLPLGHKLRQLQVNENADSNSERNIVLRRISSYDKATREFLPDETYIFANFKERAGDYTPKAPLAPNHGAIDGLSPTNTDRPVVVAIYQDSTQNYDTTQDRPWPNKIPSDPGTNTDADDFGFLTLSFTVPHLYNTVLNPPETWAPLTSTAANDDPRMQYSPLLSSLSPGFSEYVVVNPDVAMTTFDTLSAHPEGGIGFNFAGLRYKMDEGVVSCTQASTLFPSVSELSYDVLNTFTETENLPDKEPGLPIKVLYLDLKGADTISEDNYPTVKAVQDAVSDKTIADFGSEEAEKLVALSKRERLSKLLEAKDQQALGFTLPVFRQLFPEMNNVVDNLRHVIGFTSLDGDKWAAMYPDIKYLDKNSDINQAGEAIEFASGVWAIPGAMSNRGVVENATRRCFHTESPGPHFPNGNGYAADGGVGVPVYLYKFSGRTLKRKITTNADGEEVPVSRLRNVEQEVEAEEEVQIPGVDPGDPPRTVTEITTVVESIPVQDPVYEEVDPEIPDAYPDGVFYFFYDYDDDRVRRYLLDRPLVGGLCAAGDRYVGLAARPAVSAPWFPSTRLSFTRRTDTDEFGTFAESMTSFTKEVGKDFVKSFVVRNDAQDPERYRPIGPPALYSRAAAELGVPVYLQFLSAGENRQYIDTKGIGEEVKSLKIGGKEVLGIKERFGAKKPTFRHVKTADDQAEVPDARSQYLNFYLYRPTVFGFSQGQYNSVPGRGLLVDGHRAHFSRVGKVEEYANPVTDYFSRIYNRPGSVEPLSKSDIDPIALSSTTGDPSTVSFFTNSGSRDPVVSVLADDADNFFIGTREGVRQVAAGSVYEQPRFKGLTPFGVTSNFVSDSGISMVAQNSSIYGMRYYREAGTFITDLLNKETRKIGRITHMVPLIGKHKLVLALSAEEDGSRLYCLSLNNQRGYKGMSFFDLPVKARAIRKIDEDTVGILTTFGEYFEMSFDVNENTAYRDLIRQTVSEPYKSSVSCLPVMSLSDQLDVTNFPVAVTGLTIGLSGIMEFQLGFIDDVEQNNFWQQVRHTADRAVDEPLTFSGLYSHRLTPPFSSNIPRVTIEVLHDKPFTLSTLILELNGATEGQV